MGDEAEEGGDDDGGVEWYDGRLLDENEWRMSSMADTADVADVGLAMEEDVGDETEETDDSVWCAGCWYGEAAEV